MKKILYNANIITMEEEIIKKAVCFENGKILKVGTNEEVLKLKDSNDEIIDMKGKTILPSFIDPHSHFSSVANSFLQVNLNKCNSFAEIKECILKYIKENKIKENEWITASGYDHNHLKEQNHPKKDFLDTFLPNNPIVLQHQSGHVGVFNSKALNVLNVTENTTSPTGGIIEKVNGEITGYMEELAFIKYLKLVPMPSIEKLLEAYKKAQDKYLSYGITTVQEGYMSKELIPLYKALLNSGILKIDVVGYPDLESIEEYKKEFPNSYKKYDKHFKFQGLKMILDGSPQGRTAWMKSPYIGEKEYKGYPSMKYENIIKNIQYAKENNMQILAHCNGDMAAEEYIKACKEVGNVEKIRPVIIHAQLIDEEELDEAKKLGLIPSFFVAHVYHWGDTHIKNFGLERASKISPVKSAINRKMIYTLHQDSPIIEPNMLETIWCAVKRQTKEGVILGNNEKITVLEALKGVTINAAYQYFEENEKGSIKEGKEAKFVVLDKNILDANIDEITDIKIINVIN